MATASAESDQTHPLAPALTTETAQELEPKKRGCFSGHGHLNRKEWLKFVKEQGPFSVKLCMQCCRCEGNVFGFNRKNAVAHESSNTHVVAMAADIALSQLPCDHPLESCYSHD